MDNNQNEMNTPVEVPKGQAIKSLVFGILSIVLSFYPIGSIIAIIFSRIAVKNAKEFTDAYPESPACGLAKGGRITGKIGLPLSIVMTVFWVIYIVAVAAIAALASLAM